ncbi:MarC family protein [Paraburkholderia aspalathi]|nr:MarC family protein [Paraburkholderia aspalathi]
MSFYDSIFSALVTLLVTIDPPGLAPLFLALTPGMDAKSRGQVAARSTIIGFIVLTIFAIAGAQIMNLFGITIGAFRVAGGLLLFWIAFEMIFSKRTERKEKSAEIAITKDHIRNIAAFPLAIPLIAGPGAISAVILLSDALRAPAERSMLVLVIFACLFITYIVLMLAQHVDRFLGETGRSILTRLLGVILAALAVQFVADGIKALIAG